MTLSDQPLSHLLQRARIQVRRYIPGSVPRRTMLSIILIVIGGALTVTGGLVLLQPNNPSPLATGANESGTAPGAQLASAISAEGTHLSNDLHRRSLDSGTPNENVGESPHTSATADDGPTTGDRPEPSTATADNDTESDDDEESSDGDDDGGTETETDADDN